MDATIAIAAGPDTASAEFLEKGRVARMRRKDAAAATLANDLLKEGRLDEANQVLNAFMGERFAQDDHLVEAAPEDLREFLSTTRVLETLFRFYDSHEVIIERDVYGAYGFANAADLKRKMDALAAAWEGDVLVETRYFEATGATRITFKPMPEIA